MCSLLQIIIILFQMIGNNPDAKIITDNFVDAIGNKHNTQFISHSDHWYMGMYGHWSDVPTEELCAWRCLSSKLERCMFYFWGHGHCQLGNYINTGNARYGHFDVNTKYKVLKTLGIRKLKTVCNKSIFSFNCGLFQITTKSKN